MRFCKRIVHDSIIGWEATVFSLVQSVLFLKPWSVVVMWQYPDPAIIHDLFQTHSEAASFHVSEHFPRQAFHSFIIRIPWRLLVGSRGFLATPLSGLLLTTWVAGLMLVPTVFRLLSTFLAFLRFPIGCLSSAIFRLLYNYYLVLFQAMDVEQLS